VRSFGDGFSRALYRVRRIGEVIEFIHRLEENPSSYFLREEECLELTNCGLGAADTGKTHHA
jgi:hypothetical protein